MTIHHTADPFSDTSTPDPHQGIFARNTLGFWMYLMTDCLLFGSLFCAYAVLRHSTFGGPTSNELFSLPLAFSETMVLLLSSVTCGFGILAAQRSQRRGTLLWLSLAFLLGASFVTMELFEFTDLVHRGHSWEQSAFLSAFFSLVGTHGTHVSVGLFWLAIMLAQVYFKGITTDTFRRLVIFSMFWHFLDLVWIFIFTFVYLMGVL